MNPVVPVGDSDRRVSNIRLDTLQASRKEWLWQGRREAGSSQKAGGTKPYWTFEI